MTSDSVFVWEQIAAPRSTLDSTMYEEGRFWKNKQTGEVKKSEGHPPEQGFKQLTNFPEDGVARNIYQDEAGNYYDEGKPVDWTPEQAQNEKGNK